MKAASGSATCRRQLPSSLRGRDLPGDEAPANRTPVSHAPQIRHNAFLALVLVAAGAVRLGLVAAEVVDAVVDLRLLPRRHGRDRGLLDLLLHRRVLLREGGDLLLQL